MYVNSRIPLIAFFLCELPIVYCVMLIFSAIDVYGMMSNLTSNNVSFTCVSALALWVWMSRIETSSSWVELVISIWCPSPTLLTLVWNLVLDSSIDIGGGFSWTFPYPLLWRSVCHWVWGMFPVYKRFPVLFSCLFTYLVSLYVEWVHV